MLPEYPQEVGYLWWWYLEVKRTPEPLAWGELRSWSEMTATVVCGRDAQALMRIDDAILKAGKDDDKNRTTDPRSRLPAITHGKP